MLFIHEWARGGENLLDFSKLNPLRLTTFASSPEGGAFTHLSVSGDKAPPSGELARRQA